MTAAQDEITDIQVPHPSGSGTYSIISLVRVEARIQELTDAMTGNSDHDNLLIGMQSYLTGYRDALMNKKPAIL